MCAAAHMHRPVGGGVPDDPPARASKLCVGRGALTPPPSTHRTTQKNCHCDPVRRLARQSVPPIPRARIISPIYF